MINLEMDTNLTMPTFGMEPKDLKEFVKALHSIRVIVPKQEDSTKKRDLKAEAKDKKRQQNRLVI